MIDLEFNKYLIHLNIYHKCMIHNIGTTRRNRLLLCLSDSLFKTAKELKNLSLSKVQYNAGWVTSFPLG